MIEHVHHPAFPPPTNPDISIWRYLTWPKFDWLVNEGRLFMPSAAHLGDPLEGTQPKGDADYWEALAACAASDEQRRTVEHNRDLISRFAAAYRTRYYVSCWHVNNSINPQMWGNYAPDVQSVAIRTSFSQLRDVLPPNVEIGMIRYIDFSVDRLPTSNMLEYITHKSLAFQAERELRAVAMHQIVEGVDQQHFQANHFESETDPGFRVYAPPILVANLLASVFVHPSAPDAFFKQVAASCNAHGLPSPERAKW
jgi:hypothetical protein